VEAEAFQTLKKAITADKMMVYFNPKKPIILRTEASFNEGLSAGLFQETDAGLKPVHYISRTLTDTEKRYSQTEKDALSVAWAKNRFAIYLLGAPRFKIVTSHKPLIPLFNKPTAKLPPRIEKWVMSMQDVDFEMMYVPGKDEQDPLDFLSRHPLPETGDDSVEKVVKKAIQLEHAITLTKIQEATKKDPVMQTLMEVILKGNWKMHRKDPDIMPYEALRDELYIAEDLIFRLNKIVVPETLRGRILNAAHGMGHFGMSKLKQMIKSEVLVPRNELYDRKLHPRLFRMSSHHKTAQKRASQEDGDS